jgi:arginine decarboxylase
MLAGLGGVHHCLTPEPQQVIIKNVDGHQFIQYGAQQDQASIMRLLGYQPEHMMVPMPQVERRMAS